MKYGVILSILCLFLLVSLIPLAAQDQGGFRIDQPPLGYPFQNDPEKAARNRVTLSWTRYDTESLDMNAGTVTMHHRLVSGTWGAFSVKYGVTGALGTENDGSQTWDAGAGVWVSDGPTDLAVFAFSASPQVQFRVLHIDAESGWGVTLLPFVGAEGGIQYFDQEVADEGYANILGGGSGGFQADIRFPGGLYLSPFCQVSWQGVISLAERDPEYFSFFTFSFGFDLHWRRFSLSGILQPLMADEGIFTLSLGFGF